jgi:hypothetical protein
MEYSQPIEWVQISAAIAGLIVSVVGMVDALWDASLPSNDNGIRWRFVFSRSRNEVKRLCIQGIAVGVGIASLTVNLPYNDVQLVEVTLTRWGLIGISVLVSIGTLWDWLDRRAQRRLYAQAYAYGGPERRHRPDLPESQPPTTVEVSTRISSSDGADVVIEPPTNTQP